MARIVCFLLCLRTLPLFAADPQLCQRFWEISSECEQAELLAFENGLLSDEIAFEQQVLRFLEEAPAAFFNSLAMLLSSAQFDANRIRTGDEIAQTQLLRRKRILMTSASVMAVEDWEKVWPYLEDPIIFDFLASSLLSLEVLDALVVRSIDRRVVDSRQLTFVQALKNSLPDDESLLRDSRLFRTAFQLAAQKKKKLKLDLEEASGRKKAVMLVENRTFGPPQKFRSEWFGYITFAFFKLIGRVPLASAMEDPSERAQFLRFCDEMELCAPHLRSLLYGLSLYSIFGGRIHSPETIRSAIYAKLNEHHEILKELVESGKKQALQNEHPPERSAIETRLAEARITPVEGDLNDLAFYAQAPERIHALQADRDYSIRIRSRYGHRNSVRTVRFSKRALSEMLDRRQIDRVKPEEWIEALLQGPAAARGQRGIKLLSASPFSDLPHIDMEIKLVSTGQRFYGWRDHENRMVFELIADTH